ncbi:hypothetical protein [Dechloromonas sp. H13]|uniref:hypothetical protein n=1 Tax=Dechloromonas sp. H13 TaxID=2570193 RepID=UPI001290FCE7|nr:hypothetical protein [Dechloromonas sp. H13]
MNEQFEQFSQSMSLFRDLGTVTLSGSEEMIFWQLDSAQAFIALGSQQLRMVLSEASAAQDPEHWSEIVPAGMRNALQVARDCVLAASDCQMEGLRIFQRQAAEARQLFTESLGAQSPRVKLVRSADKKGNRTASVHSQRQAA